MKKYLLGFSVFILTSTAVTAQIKPKVTVLPKKPVPVVVLKNSLDSFYYALGVNIAFNLKDQGVESVNNDFLKKGMDVVFKNQPIAITEQQANTCIQNKLKEYGVKKQAEAAKMITAEKEKGKEFLAANAKRTGVVSLPDGLQYEVLKSGDVNSVKPGFEDTVVANYAGTLINGQEFDNSYKRGQPLIIAVNGVIRGWTEILQQMHIGDKWKVFIPSDLGYQDRGAGAIPGGSTLIFEMELLGVKPAIKQTPVIDPNQVQAPVEEKVAKPVEDSKKVN